jgi:hypothetical protein
LKERKKERKKDRERKTEIKKEDLRFLGKHLKGNEAPQFIKCSRML